MKLSNNPLVSFLLPVYKEPPDWIKKSVLSCINQTYANIEVVLISDGYVTSTFPILEELSNTYSNIILHINEQNLGLPFTLNKALSLANGDFIARLDADDFNSDIRITKQLQAYNDCNNSQILIGSGLNLIDQHGNFLKKRVPFAGKRINSSIYAIFSTPMFHPTWFAPRHIFERLLYRDIKGAEDYDFLLRALRSGITLLNLEDPLVNYRIHSSSISNMDVGLCFETKLFLVTNYRKGSYVSCEEIEKFIAGLDIKKLESFQRASTLLIRSQTVSIMQKMLFIIQSLIISDLMRVRLLFIICAKTLKLIDGL